MTRRIWGGRKCGRGAESSENDRRDLDETTAKIDSAASFYTTEVPDSGPTVNEVTRMYHVERRPVRFGAVRPEFGGRYGDVHGPEPLASPKFTDAVLEVPARSRHSDCR